MIKEGKYTHDNEMISQMGKIVLRQVLANIMSNVCLVAMLGLPMRLLALALTGQQGMYDN